MNSKNDDEDFLWFVQNYDKLFRKYGHKYFAIKNKKILGVYDSFQGAYNTTCLTETPRTFIIQECTGDKWGYTVRVISPLFVK